MDESLEIPKKSPATFEELQLISERLAINMPAMFCALKDPDGANFEDYERSTSGLMIYLIENEPSLLGGAEGRGSWKLMWDLVNFLDPRLHYDQDGSVWRFCACKNTAGTAISH